jgi:UDP-N-acetylmuramate--alanine ligase
VGEPIDLSAPRSLHVVGVGGAGMSAIAEVLATMGHQVSGSDAQASAVVDRLRSVGVGAVVGHDGANVPAGVDAVAISTAVGADNPEVVEARRRGVPVLRRADVLSALTRLRRTIAVAGTHGKTTTCSLLAGALTSAGLDPSFVVGGVIADFGTGARWGGGEWLVVEADESDGTFLDLGAEIAVVTSVEPDHLEHYGGFDGLVDAFRLFLAGAPQRLVCADDPLAAGLGAATSASTYGFEAGAGLRITDYAAAGGATSFVLGDLGRVDVPLPGRHNARNAAAAIGAALLAGAAFEGAAAGVTA